MRVKKQFLDSSNQGQRALSRWEDEGGANAVPPPEQADEAAQLTNVELVQLRVRVIALENLVIALLADAPVRQLAVAREMATYISPRPGFTPHPLTTQAATHMVDLIDRAVHFQGLPS